MLEVKSINLYNIYNIYNIYNFYNHFFYKILYLTTFYN